ncbi:MAG: phosphoserine phosphatase [Gammaproteobacteria bacterium SG8_15]|nr:MAG: phosphoserine phosphatase [Gammaproteobacteria bacterium SG8_15]
MPLTIIHTHTLSQESQDNLLQTIPGDLTYHGDHYRLLHDELASKEKIITLRDQLQVDINNVPERFIADQVALLITDMDSTLISIECVDEIADFLGIKEQVAKITESAMRGEIDFNTSLQQRVGLLKDLDYSVLEKVYNERLALNPGAEKLIAGLQAMGIKTALVSGGFKYFTDRLKNRLNLDYTLSNVLDVNEVHLTGKVLGNIVNGEAKANFLVELAEKLGVDLNRTIAVGDGANDLLMLGRAGLGVAYRAKPKVQQQADVVLNHASLDAILHFIHPRN